jgi:hypothetical protein
LDLGVLVYPWFSNESRNIPQALLKVTIKKIPTQELVFSFMVGPPGLEPG